MSPNKEHSRPAELVAAVAASHATKQALLDIGVAEGFESAALATASPPLPPPWAVRTHGYYRCCYTQQARYSARC